MDGDLMFQDVAQHTQFVESVEHRAATAVVGR